MEEKIYCHICGAETYNAKDQLCDFCWEMDVRLRFAAQHRREATRKIIRMHFPELTDLGVVGKD
ncbi:hypothetical protein EDC39_10822 [Geothermobacter ehrlichii]|uniref:Uncharacterized protein n=1 Tax=Geothermobacter ehrlichii TaxID=213224 RepID=A0A5D3WIU4_9BACT|nr:hypothetical protein [Geothermobacter ehrlichii]TYO98085.1 hypothetical protein EDC39_10822 [Geothermobacter ehrlichii]